MKNRLSNITTITLFTCAVMMAQGCARQISPGTYAAGAVGETSRTYAGTVVHARPVLVEDKEYLEQNGLGLIGGGLGGAYVGSHFGKGQGKDLATIGGAIAGATAGAFAEKALKSQNGMEYIVALHNGESHTVVQGTDPVLGVGQDVYLIISNKGRSRVIPR